MLSGVTTLSIKVMEIKIKHYKTIKDYLDKIKPYSNDKINDHKTEGEWKIKLTMAINCFSSKVSEESRIMYSPSDNIEIIMVSETDKIIEELFKSLFQGYQE